MLLDTLAPAKARIVLLAPLRLENLGRPLPDPAAENKNLRLYGDAVKEVAKKRDCTFADMNEFLGDGPKAAPLTDDEMHLTGAGYWRSAFALERALGLPQPEVQINVSADGKQAAATNARLGKVETSPLRFQVASVQLPLAAPTADRPARSAPFGRVLSVGGLPEGRYTLTIDGKAVAAATAAEWAKGVTLDRGPDFEQAEQLRQAIVAKNRLYFYRWRPANETYLFGFRKAEQGKNAVEIPEFDPLVAEKEKEIAKLRIPTLHTYELKLEAKQ